MINADFTLVQVLGVIALALISTGVVGMVIRNYYSKQERGVAIDERVSGGWKRYAEKLEKQMDVKNTAHDAEIARKDAIILEQEQTIRTLNHSLRNAETTVRITSDVKAIESKQAKEELHQAVDESIGKMTP